MDVVHHSSDMIGKESTKSYLDEKGPDSPRKVIKPIYTDAKASLPPSPEPSHEHEGPKSDWPDPIDTPVLNDDDTDDADDKPVTPTPIADATPLFLPDTKVEKRPLGGFSGAHISDTEKDTDENQGTTEPNDPSNEAPVEPITLPPELEPDLVAIEEGDSIISSNTETSSENANAPPADETSGLKPTDDTDDVPANDDFTVATDNSDIALIPESDKPPQPEETSPSKTEITGLLAAGSIPQQYKTAAAANEISEPTHPIFFDADQYDKASTQTTTKKKTHTTTAFQWIFIIVGLLLLGATLGAALFVFVSSK